MIPIIELRGGIPLAAALGMPCYFAYPLAVAGNFLPVPFILLFIRAILDWMKKVKFLCKIALWLEKKAEKNSKIMVNIPASFMFLFADLKYWANKTALIK